MANEGTASRAPTLEGRSALLVLMLVGLVVRLWVVWVGDELSADEAIPGLMGLHIARGSEAPVFFWGQHYFGAVEAYLIAGLFKLLGFHPWLAIVPPIAASLVLVPITAGLGGQMGGPRAGILAALPVALPPPVLARLYANSGGGFSLAFMLHGLALLCYLRAYQQPERALPWAAAFSFVSGILSWIWQPALALYAALLCLLLVRQPGLRRPARLAPIVAPLAIGLAPPLIYNLQHGWPSVAELTLKYVSPAGEARIVDERSPWAVLALLLLAFGGGNELEGGANVGQAVLVAVSIPLTLILLLVDARRECRAESHRRLHVAAVLAFAALIDALAAHNTVRHLAPVALIAFGFVGALLALIWSRVRLGGLVALAVVLAVLVAPNLWLDVRAEQVAQRVVARASEVQVAVEALETRGLSTGYGDYWSAYPVTYFSGEQVTVPPSLVDPWGVRFDRYPPYRQLVDSVVHPERVFVLVDDRCSPEPYLASLVRVGATSRVERVSRWHLIWDLHPPAGSEGASLAALHDAIASNAAAC